MARSDVWFRLGVIVVGGIVAVCIIGIRFCGQVTLPPRPAAIANRPGGDPTPPSRSQSPTLYQDFLASDAAAAGVPAPTLAEMGRRLVHRADHGRYVVEIGQPAIELAGLRVAALRSGDTIVLDIHNPTGADLAYLVVSTPVPNASGCSAAPARPINAMVIARGRHEQRVECYWRDGMAIVLSRVETIELTPLGVWYVGQVPPSLVGVEDRIARGHRGPAGTQTCPSVVAQAVRSGLERGEIGWRDLVDFYARHRCHTYQFPAAYRAFTSDLQHPLPAISSGM